MAQEMDIIQKLMDFSLKDADCIRIMALCERNSSQLKHWLFPVGDKVSQARFYHCVLVIIKARLFIIAVFQSYFGSAMLEPIIFLVLEYAANNSWCIL